MTPDRDQLPFDYNTVADRLTELGVTLTGEWNYAPSLYAYAATVRMPDGMADVAVRTVEEKVKLFSLADVVSYRKGKTDMPAKLHTPIPKNFPVKPLKPGQKAEDKVTCGHCNLSWDDAKVTSYTPAPGGRCPFEAFHIYPDDQLPPPTPRGEKLLGKLFPAITAIAVLDITNTAAFDIRAAKTFPATPEGEIAARKVFDGWAVEIAPDGYVDQPRLNRAWQANKYEIGEGGIYVVRSH